MSTKDKTATLKLGDYTLNLTYNDNEFIVQDSEEKLPYEKRSNRIVIDYNDEKMVFREN